MLAKRLIVTIGLIVCCFANCAKGQVSPGELPGATFGDSQNFFGFNNDWNSVCTANIGPYCTMKLRDFERAKEGGFGYQRYNISWALVNPAPGVFDFSTADAAIERATQSGIATWIYISGAPAWATGGAFWGETWHCAVHPSDPPEIQAKYNAPPYNGFRADIPECGNASLYPIDRVALETMIRTTMNRFPEVRYWSFGNEFHNYLFWPPGWGKTAEEGHQSAIDQVFKPGYETVKSVNPEAIVIGPDEDSPPSLEIFLRLEAEGVARGGRPLFDTVSIHCYGKTVDIAWGLRHVLVPLFDKYANGKEIWITEFGYPTNDNPDPAIAETNQAEWHRQVLQTFWEWAARWNSDKWRLTKAFVYRLTDGKWSASQIDDSPGFGIIHADEDSTPRAAWYVFQNFWRDWTTPPTVQVFDR